MNDYRRIATEYLVEYSTLYQEYCQEKAQKLRKPFTEIRRYSNLPIDMTGLCATKEVAYDLSKNEYYWLQAVKLCEEELSDTDKDILQYRREAAMQERKPDRKPSWVPYVTSKLCLNSSFVKNRWKNISMVVIRKRNELIRAYSSVG